MEILKLTLIPINNREFTVSAESYGSERSQLPFFDDSGNSHIYTVLNALNAITKKYSSQNNDREWMINAGLLNPEYSNFYHDQMREIIGKQLYTALFPGNIKPPFNQTDLHISIEYDFKTIKDSNLSLYPWHLAHDSHDFLVQKGLSFSYSIAHPNSLPSGKRKIDKLKVLVISSQAADGNLEKLTNQETLINDSLQQLRYQGKASLLSWHESQTPTYTTLRNYLTENRRNKDKMPDIIHFNGHGVFKRQCDNPSCPKSGTNEIFFNKGVANCQHCGSPLKNPTGFLLFPDEQGNADYISAERFADLIEICDPKPQLIVITACKGAYADYSNSVFNGVAQNLLQKVPAVVATPFSISENSLKGFIEQFYRVLSNGTSSLLEAVRLATNEMKFKDYEWYRPVIFLRHDGDKNGYLFEFEETADLSAILNNKKQKKEELLDFFRSNWHSHQQLFTQAYQFSLSLRDIQIPSNDDPIKSIQDVELNKAINNIEKLDNYKSNNFSLIDYLIGYLRLNIQDTSSQIYQRLDEWIKNVTNHADLINIVQQKINIIPNLQERYDPCLLITIDEGNNYNLIIKAWLIENINQYDQDCYFQDQDHSNCQDNCSSQYNNKWEEITRDGKYEIQGFNNLSDGLPKLIDNLLFKVSDKVGRVGKIQFFLPCKFIAPIDSFSIRRQGGYLSLGAHYEVNIRFVERTKKPVNIEEKEIMMQWRNNCRQLKEIIDNRQSINFMELEYSDNRNQLIQLLNQQLAIRLNFAVVSDKIETVMNVLYNTSIPLAIWVREEVDNYQQNLDRICRQSRCLNTLSEVVRNQRLEAEENNHHIGRHLSFLWDDYYLLPPKPSDKFKQI
ncbi:CHAT domain-containing protein [Sphaerospermopsis aphanizomenoides BCCUSP55]|uniref:VMAP-C domain-containing protein n=1 Tax=Sphaerospermopsis aphanizomenoides TaxID=459663 RepID=UPI001903E64C|nr:CHAT domain-containing protein [Sphaerospermopsis aphanizomenoides]MBK1990214.1 CHAT domain-containing protein [Sphaerospermopsis aphanizomenoides BCCUSP55]